MAQIYLLSVLVNLVAGLALSGDFLGARLPFLAFFAKLRGNRGGRAAIGLAALATGIAALFVRSPGDTLPLAGDLLPALGGIAMGGLLLLEVFFVEVGESGEGPGEGARPLARRLIGYRVPLGLAGIAIALLHLVLPAAPLI